MAPEPLHGLRSSDPSARINGASKKDESYMMEPAECSANVQSTPEIEKKYVHHVYDAIAPHFSSTRFAKWPKVAAFLNSLTPGSIVLDAGCGNGKYLGFNSECFFIGCDISASLIGICAGRDHEVLVADAVNLPYRSGFGDAAISIAVLHHLSTEARRRKAIEELLRVVRPGGHVLITVWAVEQEDKTLLNKWTPLSAKYEEEWVTPSSPRVRTHSALTLNSIPEMDENRRRDPLSIKYEEEWVSPSSPRVRTHSALTLNSIPETDENGSRDSSGLHREVNLQNRLQVKLKDKANQEQEVIANLRQEKASTDPTKGNSQEYFVPWHLPYHRVEIGGASASAVAAGLARRDDKKGAVVYSRYYHVFAEGELQSLVSGIDNAVVTDQFYDKSNWCIILEKK